MPHRPASDRNFLNNLRMTAGKKHIAAHLKTLTKWEDILALDFSTSLILKP